MSYPIAFYICAHPEDWFFFGGEVAFTDIADANIVLILTTAGNANCSDGLWRAREVAAVAAVAQAMNADTSWL